MITRTFQRNKARKWTTNCIHETLKHPLRSCVTEDLYSVYLFFSFPITKCFLLKKGGSIFFNHKWYFCDKFSEEQNRFSSQQCPGISVYFSLVSRGVFLLRLETKWKDRLQLSSSTQGVLAYSLTQGRYIKHAFIITRWPSTWYISGTVSIKN